VVLALVEGAGCGVSAGPHGNSLLADVATAFGGGFGGTHELACGALSGAILALGAMHAEGALSRDATYALAAQVVGDFERAFGTTVCSELVGVDPTSARWREVYEARRAHTEVCWPCVEFAAHRCWELVCSGSAEPSSGPQGREVATGGRADG
jgi:C_GCAxxG_C_C family probable redox protein